MNTVHVWLQANAGQYYCGTSAEGGLYVYFTQDPGQVMIDNVQTNVVDIVANYWRGLNNQSDEAMAYRSGADRAAAKIAADAVNKASATVKLKILGLSDAEINTILGN